MKYKYEGLKIGTDAFAISEYIPKDKKHSHHYGVFSVKIKEVIFTENGVSYWLTTPRGEDWGDTVEGENVSDNQDELIEKLKLIWKEESNNF